MRYLEEIVGKNFLYRKKRKDLVMNNNRIKPLILFGLLTCIHYHYDSRATAFAQYNVVGKMGLDELERTDNITQPDDSKLTINGTGTLCQAVRVLEEMYRKPVTCEQTEILPWDDDVDQEIYDGGIARYPKRVTFVIPNEVKPDKNTQLAPSVLAKVVEAYQKQFGGPKYKILNSKWGLHLIVDEVRDKNGKFVKVKPYLDEVITVPSGKRTGFEHLKKIVDALKTSRNIKIELNSAPTISLWWQNEGLQNIPNIGRTLMWDDLGGKEDRLLYEGKMSFEWGVNKIVAREALIDLLEKSNTTLSWMVNDYVTNDGDIGGFLTINPLSVSYLYPDGSKFSRSLQYDREKKNK